jgi:hypothetical protein
VTYSPFGVDFLLYKDHVDALSASLDTTLRSIHPTPHLWFDLDSFVYFRFIRFPFIYSCTSLFNPAGLRGLDRALGPGRAPAGSAAWRPATLRPSFQVLTGEGSWPPSPVSCMRGTSGHLTSPGPPPIQANKQGFFFELILLFCVIFLPRQHRLSRFAVQII